MGPATALQPDEFFLALARLALLQREAVDRLALQEAVSATLPTDLPSLRLEKLVSHLQLRSPRLRKTPDESDLPALLASPNGRWGILTARNANGQWVADWLDPTTMKWQEMVSDHYQGHLIATLRLAPPYQASSSPVFRLIVDEIKQHKGKLAEGFVGGALLAVLGILVSFYTMQVYDRVIPTGATQTLLVLTLGIVIAILLEYVTKRLRSKVYEGLVDQVDQRLARTVYLRFLSIRLDQMPPSVGALASQLRGYETVRGFLMGIASQLAVDAPFALVFVAVIGFIAGPLAFIPLGFFILAIGIGFWNARPIRRLAQRGQHLANRKTGILVESVEGAEIIKSGQGGWRMLGRWLAGSDESRAVDLETRNLNEASQYRVATLQQLSYVSLVAVGAWMASRGEITMGALIACSILSSRVFTPATMLSNQITAWAHVRAALQGLDSLWQLEGDHHGQDQPVVLEQLRGAYRLEGVAMALRGQPVLKVPQLKLQSGEKVGVIGPIGGGKTTLLRLLSGMYKPTEGRILLDDVDLAHISKPKLAEQIGYLPQEGRLLGGTLRDNLLLGLSDPGDDAIMRVANLTGLYEAVIAPHPQGLQQEISEGGTGLSGGQRQLVNLTRVFLRAPTIWLLDEPTASLDRTVEAQVLRALRATLKPDDTLILVTHKPELLALVDRIVVLAKGQIVMDGPRNDVLAKLKAASDPSASQSPNSAPTKKAVV